MSEVAEAESTELVTLPARESALAVYSTAGGLDPLIEQIREKVAGVVYDMTTAKGRDECRSDAAKVGRSKQAIERLGKEVSAEQKEVPKKIDAERRRAFDELEALQAQVRQPLTEWEAKEEARIATHKANVAWFDAQVERCAGQNSAAISKAISDVQAVKIGYPWQEFETEALRRKSAALEDLATALAEAEKREAEQAELARLREEAEARRIQDEKDRIAREAAERATREAEAKAQAERDAAAKREADAKAAAEKAEHDRLEAIERQKQAEARAEAEKLAAEQRAKDAAEAARLAEVKRQADEAARIEAEQRKREADRAHRAKIMGAAKEAIMIEGIDEEQARAVVLAIVRGEVPHVTINF